MQKNNNSSKNASKALDDKIRHSVFFKSIVKILSNYECPASCKGHCCKREQIEIGHGDYLKLRALKPNVSETLKYSTVGNIGIYVLDSPCQFIHSDRCTVNGVKPIPCVMYPFVFHEMEEGYVGIHPCPLGLMVAKDINGILRAKNLLSLLMEGRCDSDIQSIMEWQDKLYENWIQQKDDFFKKSTIGPLLFPQEALEFVSGVITNVKTRDKL